MIYYNRTEIFEGINGNDISESRECDVCHYWYFQDKGLKFQTYVCNG